jgi:hypothetical protein
MITAGRPTAAVAATAQAPPRSAAKAGRVTASPRPLVRFIGPPGLLQLPVVLRPGRAVERIPIWGRSPVAG